MSSTRSRRGLMADLVDPDEIEEKVGAKRHAYQHLGRAVSEEQQVYILHSQSCRALHVSGKRDMRACIFTVALSRGIVDLEECEGREDQVVALSLSITGRLVPGVMADD